MIYATRQLHLKYLASIYFTCRYANKEEDLDTKAVVQRMAPRSPNSVPLTKMLKQSRWKSSLARHTNDDERTDCVILP